MTLLKITISQIFKFITKDKFYPNHNINTKNWDWQYDKNGNVKYNHLKTLFNHLLQGA